MLLASCAEQGLPTPADTTDNSITENNGESVDMYVTDLMVNNLIEPMGIDTVPTFRWINNMAGYARSQSAYRIIVSSSRAGAEAHVGDIWDSGKIEGNCNYDIVYGGSPLKSRTEYFFAVQVWDEKGEDAWSDVSKFETGILDDSEWTAKWIGITDGDTVPCDMDLRGANWIWLNAGTGSTTYFRGHFTVNEAKEVDEVLLLTTMDDYGFLFVNSESVLNVYKETNAWKTGRVVNITRFVQKGDNVFGARIIDTGSSAGFIAKIEICYTDGSVDTVVTDKKWKCSKSVTSTSGWERIGGVNDASWSSPDPCVAYGGGAWKSNVNIPDTMQVNVGGSAPRLRKTFGVEKEIKKARIYVSGLGLYELYVNGKLPDDTVLNPAHTQYEDTVHYRVYDVTDMLASGKNALAVELGNYFYNCDFYTWMNWNTAVYRDEPKLLLELHIEYTDGSSELVVTDESWRTYEYGPVTYNNIYLGEQYDARLEIEGWQDAGFDDTAWKNAKKVNAPTGDLVFENMEPIRRLESFKPTVTDKGSGTFVIKNPVMTTGWARISFEAPAGTRIKITYGEKRDAFGFVETAVNGYQLQIDEFVTSGGKDVYEPKYSYKGYEYIQIENYPGTLTADDVDCYLIANDIRDISTFETGSERINYMHGMMLRTVMNNLQGKLTDTPVYEKNGWTGDVNFALDSFNFNFDFSSIIQKILVDFEDSANANGVVAQTAPAAYSGGSSIPIWTSIFINGYYENWQVNGITSAIEEHYDAIRLQTLDYISCIRANGWVWTTGSYADWMSPNPSELYTTGKTTHAPEGAAIIGSAFVYRTLGEMAEIAELLGKADDAAEYRDAMQKIYTAFNAKFYDKSLGYYTTGYWDDTYDAGRTKYRQASNIIPLMFGLCPDEYAESVVKSIVDDIRAKDNHLDVGAVGTKYILPMLSKYGYGELALELIMQSTYPSWGYWIELGANTCWESYESNARSRNHFFLGTYTDWFYKNLAGISEISNGYETVTLSPEIYAEIGYVDYSLDTVRGMLKSHWRFTDEGTVVWQVVIPVGSSASVYLPADADISAYPWIVDNGEYLTVPSGSYTFVMDADDFGACESSAAEEDEHVTAERVKLSALIEEAGTVRAENVPVDAYKVLHKALSDAKKTLSGGSAAECESVYSVLKSALEEVAKAGIGNLALKKTATVSSTLNNGAWHENKLTDGDEMNLRGTEMCGWTSNYLTAFNHAEWVVIDLGTAYDINRVEIMPAGAAKGGKCYAFPSGFYLAVSEDGVVWKTVIVEQDYPIPTAKMQTFEFTTVRARYVRFVGTDLRMKPSDSNKYRMQIAEIGVYNVK